MKSHGTGAESPQPPRQGEAEGDHYPEIEMPSFEVAEPVMEHEFGVGQASAVVSLLAEQLAAFERAGGSFARLGGSRAVAERMMAVLPTASPWNEALGAFYTTAQVGRLLGDVSRQAVAARRAGHTLVALRTADEQWVYPAFQFDTRLGLLPGLGELWAELVRSGEDCWTLARWLVAGHDELSGRSVVEALKEGVSVEDLRPLVRDAVRRFSH